MKTKSVSKEKIERQWHLVDLDGEILGRMATQMAKKLVGKDKPYFTPNLDCGDYVVAINAANVRLTRKKAEKKLYRYHTGYPGGFREIPFIKLMEKDPTKVVERAVSGMLPKNKLRSKRFARLKVFVGEQHPYKDKFSDKG